MTTDQTITVTVKPEIDREAVEEAAQLAAALFLSSFAVAVLDGITAAEPPEEVLARVKTETLEKAAQEGEAPSLADLDLISGEGAAAYLRLAMAVQDATVVAQPAQTLADLTPCLGDRVRVVDEFIRSEREVTFTWIRAQRDFGWLDDAGNQCTRPDQWPVLEHLDPVTPEEPPVGAGMLVDRDRALWRHDKDGWRFNDGAWSERPHKWSEVLDVYPCLRPATPADLAEHGVDEQGEPAGKGEWSVTVPRDLIERVITQADENQVIEQQDVHDLNLAINKAVTR